AEQTGRRRQRRIFIRIREDAALGPALNLAGTCRAARRRKDVLVVIASHDRGQPFLVDPRPWQLLGQRGRRRKGRRNRQRQQKSARKSDHYPPSAAKQPPNRPLIAPG